MPRCAGCGELLSPGEGALCGDCRNTYETEQERTCPYCGLSLPTCRCAGAFLEKNGVRRLVKLFRYYPNDAEAVTNRMIYLLKHHAPRSLVSLFAKDLAAAIRPEIRDGLRVIVTYAPRSRRARRRDGLDHMKYLSRAVARKLGAEWRPLLARHGGGEQKKRTTKGERMRNMKNAYSYIGKGDLAGCQVILLDDVATSGATLMFASRLLRRAGAKRVTAAVLGSTFIKN